MNRPPSAWLVPVLLLALAFPLAVLLRDMGLL